MPSGLLEHPFVLASTEKLLTANFFLLTTYFPEEMFMRFEASKAFDGRKRAFSNCTVFSSQSVCVSLCMLSLEAMLRVWLGPELS